MTSIEIKGELFPSQSSNASEMAVVLDSEQCLHLYDSTATLVAFLAYDELSIENKIGSVPREIVIPNHGLLVVDSTPEVDNWLNANGSLDKAAAMESNQKFIIAGCIGVPVALYGFFVYLIPILAVTFAHFVPDNAIKVASQQTLTMMDYQMLEPSKLDESKRAQLSNEMSNVIDVLPTDTEQFSVQFRYSEVMGANAFALPDGTIVITDQFVELIESDTDLLIAVLLHEIGHVEKRHSMRLIAETLVTAMAVDFFLGDLGALIEVFAGLVNSVAQNQFSQELEWEADNFALEQLDYLGRDRADFAKAMEKLAVSSGDATQLETFLSSHPNIKERIMNAKGQNALDD